MSDLGMNSAHEPQEGNLVAFGPPDEIVAVYQRHTAAANAGCLPGEHWFRIGDDFTEDPLDWKALLRSHERDQGPHVLTVSALSGGTT